MEHPRRERKKKIGTIYKVHFGWRALYAFGWRALYAKAGELYTRSAGEPCTHFAGEHCTQGGSPPPSRETLNLLLVMSFDDSPVLPTGFVSTVK